MAGNPRRRASVRIYHLWLLLPCAVLWVPFYNRLDPVLAGIPFFYWFQMAWVVATVLAVYIVYHCERRDGGRP
jgi:hypothetical protein